MGVSRPDAFFEEMGNVFFRMFSFGEEERNAMAIVVCQDYGMIKTL